ncbi:BQ5605_C033g11186 [Microbotryum silenes-dioicae]|uniref:BQ5605_C033g11186 protein n=1 Tax=Microbotryum silenes-dioicae TaxID=796604 RepID=A0A2X0MJN1_9BASI|nr:BQ5605_C033g11186 [Microbotryum silenes-dioicae]
MSQIAFACNRRKNAMPEEIGSKKYSHVTVDNIDVTHHVND